MLEPVRTAIVHREFGEVSLAIEPVDGGLLVAMKSADPGFVPAVQAASAPGDAGTTRSDAGAGGGAASATGSNGGQSGQQRAPDRHATPDGQRLPPGGQNRPKRDARDIYA